MNVLVVGGAGYIGSHMVQSLGLSGHKVITVDNLSTGHADSVHYGKFINIDLADSKALCALFANNKFDVVVHFAASSIVAESMSHPAKYYQNNLVGTLNLLNAMISHDCRRLVFSSTAAVYGLSNKPLITEEEPTVPINPYGRSKLMLEQVMWDYNKAYGLQFVALRYFNAAGAVGQLKERHNPETHLIPIVLEVASGERVRLDVHGSDYDTADGTCVRDYVHVKDLCEAHNLAINYLKNNGHSVSLNLGSGLETTVLDVVNAVQRVTGKEIPYKINQRRAGDSARLVASNKQALNILRWLPKHSDIDTIIQDAWKAKNL